MIVQVASVPRCLQLQPQEIFRGVYLSNPPLEDNAARTGHDYAEPARPRFAGVADELAVRLMVLDEGGEVRKHGDDPV
jgi:hypothetical protein